MSLPPPRIDVELRADPSTCDLSRQTRFSLVVLLTLRSKQPVTILKSSFDDYDFGLVDLLQNGTVECIDTDGGAKIPIFGQAAQSKDKETARPNLMSLSDNRTGYVTFTSALEPRDYEVGLDVSQLQLGRKYTLRSNPWDLDWWSHTSIDGCLSHFDKHGELPRTQTPPLHCAPNNSVSFSCREDTPLPPSVSVALTAPSSTLSLSGNPPFKFTTNFTSHASNALTALAERTQAININNDIDIIDATSRRHVAPDRICIDQEGPFLREDYLVLEPEKPHVEERSLTMKDGLQDLKVEHDYILRFPSTSWRWWSYDSIEDVMRLGKTHDLVGHFREEFCIDLVCRDELRIHVVE